jgi:selT/selW/selH-like putative selenoprotein
VEYVPGSNGIFDIVVDGMEVFCKAREGRFPNEGEVIARIEQKG